MKNIELFTEEQRKTIEDLNLSERHVEDMARLVCYIRDNCENMDSENSEF